MQPFRKARMGCFKYERIVSPIKASKPAGSSFNKDIERALFAVYNGKGFIGTMCTFMESKTCDISSDFAFDFPLECFRSTQTWEYFLQSRVIVLERTRVASDNPELGKRH